MKLLHEQLSAMEKDVEVKIVRFEMFKSPLILCRKLFHYIFKNSDSENSYIGHSNHSICEKYFSPAALAMAEEKFKNDLLGLHRDFHAPPIRSTWDASGRSRNRINGVIKQGRRLSGSINASEGFYSDRNSAETQVNFVDDVGDRGRRLRFREGIQKSEGLDFRPDLLERSLVKRAGDFRVAMARATAKQRRALVDIHERLLEFGYGLLPDSFNSFEQKPNKLTAWEL
jgi:hypothetical protein